MHPSIPALVRETQNPELQDSPHVSTTQTSAQCEVTDRANSTSHINAYEVDMGFALVGHLVRQGVYKASDFAVLTPYLGQSRKLSQSLDSFAEIIVNERDAEELALAEESSRTVVLFLLQPWPSDVR